MTRKFVIDAETIAIKKKREAEAIQRSLEKLNPELSRKLKEKKEQQKGSKEKNKQKRAQSVKPNLRK